MPSDDPEPETDVSTPTAKGSKKPPQTYIGRMIADRYRIVGPIGRGGAGNVYRGVQEPLGREVAVKILRPDLSDESRKEWQARFLREAALAGRLSHPNVVTVHDYGVFDDGASFVVMELLNGRVLSDIIKNGRALDPTRSARLACQVARGLRAVHDAELIHRDVKPHNIMVVEEDGRERAILLDFGLVKVADMVDSEVDGYQTRAGTYMGTPAYMAPEQARGDKVDHRVDLYAMGVVLFRLLTGQVPFHAEHPLGMAVQHMTEPVPTFAQVAPKLDIPTRLEKIVRRLLEKQPDRRYRSAGDLVAELEHYLDDAPPPRAPRPPVTGAVGAGVGAIGAGVGLLGMGLAVVAVFVALIVVMLAVPQTRRRAPVVQQVDDPLPLVGLDAPEVVEPEQPTDDAAQTTDAQLAPTDAQLVPTDTDAPDASPAPSPGVGRRPLPMPGVPTPGPAPDPKPGPISDAETRTPVTPPPFPKSEPRPPSAVMVDDVGFTTDEAERTLAFANSADAEALAAAGVYRKGVEILLEKRPFASLQVLGDTYGIGKKTMLALRDGSK